MAAAEAAVPHIITMGSQEIIAKVEMGLMEALKAPRFNLGQVVLEETEAAAEAAVAVHI